jgi:hypothetical protein
MKGYSPLSLVLVALCVAGCSKSAERNLPKAPVNGTVTYTKALPQGEVIFQHASGETTVAKFGSDGKYKQDVPVGANKVMVRSQTSSTQDTNARPGMQMEIYTNHAPLKYGNFGTSKLEYTVKEGDNTFNVEMKD